MKNEYVKPEMIITSYEAENVVMTSGIDTTGGTLESSFKTISYDTFF